MLKIDIKINVWGSHKRHECDPITSMAAIKKNDVNPKNKRFKRLEELSFK